jgi:hypothetical protein
MRAGRPRSQGCGAAGVGNDGDAGDARSGGTWFAYFLERGHLALGDAMRAGRPRSQQGLAMTVRPGTPALPGLWMTPGGNSYQRRRSAGCAPPGS